MERKFLYVPTIHPIIMDWHMKLDEPETIGFAVTSVRGSFNIKLISTAPGDELHYIIEGDDHERVVVADLNKEMDISELFLKLGNKHIFFLDGSEKILEIFVPDSNIEYLNLRGFEMLKKVVCYNNNISYLDISQNKNIQQIHMHNNPMVDDLEKLNQFVSDLEDRTGKGFGSLVINNKTKMKKIERKCAEKNWLFGTSLIYDPVESLKIGWHLIRLGVTDIWESAEYGENTVVAIDSNGFDTGIVNITASNIIDKINYSSHGQVGEVPVPSNVLNTDLVYKGNGMATMIAGNGTELYGVAPKCKMYFIKTANERATTTGVSKLASMEYVRQHGDITAFVAGSLGTTQYKKLEVVAGQIDKTLIISGSGDKGDGNDLTDELTYPSSYKSVICVGNLDKTDSIHYTSNSNETLDVAVYGSDIRSNFKADTYKYWYGTDFAASICAGVACLLLNVYRKLNGREPSVEELTRFILQRTIKTNNPHSTGRGILNMLAFNDNV